MSFESQNVANEKTTGFIELTFRDEFGNLVVPNSLVWKLDDAESQLNLIPDTTVIPPDSTYVVVIPSDKMIILDPLDSYEERVLTVTYYYNLTYVATGTFNFAVKNLKFLD